MEVLTIGLVTLTITTPATAIWWKCTNYQSTTGTVVVPENTPAGIYYRIPNL
jgi:hypothetical protein